MKGTLSYFDFSLNFVTPAGWSLLFLETSSQAVPLALFPRLQLSVNILLVAQELKAPHGELGVSVRGWEKRFRGFRS